MAAISAIIFGGTVEGRKLCEACDRYDVSALYCVATADGARPVESLSSIDVHIGRLNATDMLALFEQYKPRLVVDATHPYAEEVTENIASASMVAELPLIRVTREKVEEKGCVSFNNWDELLAWLNKEPGNIFATTGASTASLFAQLPDFQARVWMRILPSVESLNTCSEAGIRPERMICMQGPFSEAINRAMFKETDANILVTKNAGASGGFSEKVRAAHSLGMQTAVLSTPTERDGISLHEACERLKELRA